MKNAEVVAESIKREYLEKLRDDFAGKAMQGICVNAGRNGFELLDLSGVAEHSYKIADAMLKVREL